MDVVARDFMVGHSLIPGHKRTRAGHSNAPPVGGAFEQEVNSRRLSRNSPVAATGVRWIATKVTFVVAARTGMGQAKEHVSSRMPTFSSPTVRASLVRA